MSHKNGRAPDVQGVLMSPHVINSALVVALMILMASWAMHGIEYAAGGAWGCSAYPGLMATVYWAITTMTTLGYGDSVATSAPGRFVTCVWSMGSYFALSTLASLITSLLTAEALSSSTINGLSDVTRTLCVESQYPLLADWVRRQPDCPNSVIFDTLSDCMAALAAGTVEAVLGERPIMTWYLSTYSLSSMYVSPLLNINPLAFVYANGTALRERINPAVIAVHANQAYAAQGDEIATLYFGAQPRVNAVPELPRVRTDLVAAVVVISAITGVAHLLVELGWLTAAAARLRRWRSKRGDAQNGSPKAAGGSPSLRRADALAAEQSSPRSGDDGDGVDAEQRAAMVTGSAARAATSALALVAEMRALSAAQAAATERMDQLQAQVALLLAPSAGNQGAKPRTLAQLASTSTVIRALTRRTGSGASLSGPDADVSPAGSPGV